MDASLITQWISEPVVRAFCWMLVHSLWIGLITAVLAGAVMMGTQQTSARLRYRLLCGTLSAFVGLTGFIMYWEWTTLPTSLNQVAVAVASFQPIIPFREARFADTWPRLDQAIVFVNQQSGLIIAGWLVVFLLKSLKLIGGLYQVHRIRYRNVHPVGDEWEAKVASFSRTLGIERTITLLQSGWVNVPVTIGWLRPVVLLPVGLLCQLPPQQIDAILWHELAHIWRRDYLMNLLQHFFEAVFFFNPGLLWVCSLIREQREVCCDELVLAHMGSKTHYVDALLAFQHVQPTFIMALGLGGHPMVNRLKRIVTQENKRLSAGEKIMLLAGLVLISAFTVIRSSKPEDTPNKTPVNGSPTKVITPVARPLVTQSVKPKRTAEMPLKPHVKAASDTVPLSPKLLKTEETIGRFTSIQFVKNNYDMANREMFVRDDKANLYHLTVVDNQLAALVINEVVVPGSDLARHIALLGQIDQAFAESQRFKREKVAASAALQEAERQAPLQPWKEVQQPEFTKRPQPGAAQKQSVKGQSKAVSPTLTPSAHIPVEPPITPFKKKRLAGIQADTAAKVQAWMVKKRPQPSDTSDDRQRVLGVLAALVKHKVVTNSSAVDWFGLSETELMVNGTRQANELHQKLKTQYGIKPDYGLFYGPIQMVGKGIIFEKSDL